MNLKYFSNFYNHLKAISLQSDSLFFYNIIRLQIKGEESYTYKRNHENEVSPIKRALEELENIKPSGIRANFDKKQRSQSPVYNASPLLNQGQRSQSPSIKEQLKQTYVQYFGQYLSPLNKQKRPETAQIKQQIVNKKN